MHALFAEQLRALHGQAPAVASAARLPAAEQTGGVAGPPRLSRGKSRRSRSGNRTTSRTLVAALECAHAAVEGTHPARPRRAGRSAYGRGLPAGMEGIGLSRGRRPGQGLKDPGHRRQRLCRPGERLRPDDVRALARFRHRRPSPRSSRTAFRSARKARWPATSRRSLRDMTGSERVTFCNTGSEAVMAAMRVARTVTGRERGGVQQRLSRPVRRGAGQGDRRRRPGRPLPTAPGIPLGSIANMTVLPYGQQRSLDWIAANGQDIAAVLVEPVQSRHPALRPVEFLQKPVPVAERQRRRAGVRRDRHRLPRPLRAACRRCSGIRRRSWRPTARSWAAACRSASWPARPSFMDALDGGTWRYWRRFRSPKRPPPSSPAPSCATPWRWPPPRRCCSSRRPKGRRSRSGWPSAWAGFVDALNRDLERRGLATRAEGYSSWFHISFAAEGPLASLFWPQMRLLGIHMQEGFPCFLTTAHSRRRHRRRSKRVHGFARCPRGRRDPRSERQGNRIGAAHGAADRDPHRGADGRRGLLHLQRIDQHRARWPVGSDCPRGRTE